MDIVKDGFYKAIDLITLRSGIKRRIGGEAILFPPKWSRYYESDYEPETFAFFRRYVRPGATILDIGGHIGLFAVVAAKLAGNEGKVFSFEPTPFTRSVLSDVVTLNRCDEVVEVRSEAMSSKSGKATFFDTGSEISNANSLVKTERSKMEIEVDLVSIDDFVAEKGISVDCLKIDVEGAELEVLKGARDTFLKFRPAARLGLHPIAIVQNGQSLDEIWDQLMVFQMRIEFDGTPVNREWFCDQTDLFDVTLIPDN